MRALRWWNAFLAVLHLVQGALMWAISNDFSLPVTAAFLTGGPEGIVSEPETLFTVRIGPLVASFLFLSGLAHLSLATFARAWYERMLEREIQPARWIEYSASSSVMIVVIAMLTGVYDVAALLALFAVNASMILFGWVTEMRNEGRERIDWMPFWFGVFAGAIPWIAIGIYLLGAGSDGAGPPGFVYGIYVSLFVFFNVFAINMVLQYRRVGRWRDYLYGERAYMLLSLFAKSALAWQVFVGTLRPS
ncbi:MAG TPA: heliorhodopsin HeR [Actinomycetota bacterium]